MEDEGWVKVQEIENWVGGICKEEYDNLSQRNEVHSFVSMLAAMHTIKEAYEDFHPNFISMHVTSQQEQNEKIGKQTF